MHGSLLDHVPHDYCTLETRESTVRVKKTFPCPFRLTDRPFPLYFLSQLRPHSFNIRLISACILSPFVRKNSRFAGRFSALVNCYSEGRTARELEMVYNEYTKRRILFFHAKGYRAPTITKWLGGEGRRIKYTDGPRAERLPEASRSKSALTYGTVASSSDGYQG